MLTLNNNAEFNLTTAKKIFGYFDKSQLINLFKLIFQGDEKDMMIFSPVISQGLDINKTRFMSKQGNLFNVAITRARSSLIIIKINLLSQIFQCDEIKARFVKHLSLLVLREYEQTLLGFGINIVGMSKQVPLRLGLLHNSWTICIITRCLQKSVT